MESVVSGSEEAFSAPLRLPARERVVVIGAGFGGLAAALRLQAAGFAVTVIEARDQPGGRASQFKSQGYTFDMGPTLLTLPHLLEELWQLAGRDMREDLDLVELSPFYRLLLRDGRVFDAWGKATQDEAAIARFAPRDVLGYRAFLAETQRIYERAFVDLARQPFLSASTMVRVLPELLRARAHRSVYSFVSRYFKNPDLRMVFSFHPLFIGGNPFRASAIYSIVPYLERLGGVHFARGGMYTLVEAMKRLFRAAGGEVRCGVPVEQLLLKESRATGVRLADGTTLAAEAVIANSDVASTLLTLLPEPYRSQPEAARMKRYRYSMSCFMLYLR